jgi:selenide,water dikinase
MRHQGPAATPVIKDVVLVGAGHAHVGVLRRFGMEPEPGVRLTLITRQVDSPYSGMLPGQVAGLYGFDDTHIDTGPLCRFAGARLLKDEAIGLDLAGKRVLCRNRPPVPFDLLSINTGSTPNTGSVPGAAGRAVPVKPIDGFLDRFDALRDRVLAAGGHARIGVVGAGAGGVELLLSLERRLRRELAAAGHDPGSLAFALVARSDDVLPGFPKRMRERFAAILRERGIEVRTASPVVRVVEGGALQLGDGSVLPLDEILWATRASPAGWLKETGLALDGGGFIRVAPTLESVSHPGVFAAGDVAALEGHALPRSGVYAVRQGPALADNLRRALTGRALAPHKPQGDALYLVSTGEPYAIGTRNGVVVEGAWVWRLKDWIDRRFMRKFNELPDMATPVPQRPATVVADGAALKEISAMAMRCGGCGAKVGATVLSRALGAIAPAERDDVVVGLDAPDDAAVVDTGGPRLAIQTVDYFRAIVDDPYLFGKIAATHALGDVYAMGGEPQTALAIATVPYGLEAKVEADLSLMMTGANEVLRAAGCALVGGHTSEGAELSLGFSVTGLVDRAAVLRKGGLAPGDALIVTKPIGTGTLLAAEMRGKAKARWVAAAVEHMAASNGAAAGILKRHGAHAATDVTGFGLLGHLVEMVKASGVDVTLHLAAVPLLDGARETLAMGIFSSLQPQNVRLRRAIRNLDEAAWHPLYPMLFDPQTAGGLLASVPGGAAADCLAELRVGGYPRAAIIGRVAPASDALEPVTLDLSDRPPSWPCREPAGDAGRWTEAVRERERARGLVP